MLEALDVPALAPYRAMLAAEPNADGLRTLFTTWITMPEPAMKAVLPPTLDACVALLRRNGVCSRGTLLATGECRVILELAETYPGDVGVLAALLLNHVVLASGEAMYLPAGNLHTYLRGTGVEISANSDNVLRGGLTSKHIDVPELLRVLDFSYGALPVQRGEPVGPHETAYRTLAEEFQLTRLEWAHGESTPICLHSQWPQILLCTQGSARLHSLDGGGVTVRRGGSVWLAAEDPEVTVCPGPGPVQLFRALPGLSTVASCTPCRHSAPNSDLSAVETAIRLRMAGWVTGGERVSAGAGKAAIVAALAANAGIAAAKFVGFLVTGSSSMLAEAVHSVADTSNQGLVAARRQALPAGSHRRASVRLRSRPLLLLLRGGAAAVQPRFGVRAL